MDWASVAGFLVAGVAQAHTVASNNQGWVNSLGGSNGGFNGNVAFAGNEFDQRYNSWASFDLSGLSGVVTSAKLELFTTVFPANSGLTYNVGVYDVSTPLSALLGNTSGVAGYSDLRSGNLYASEDFGDLSTISLTLSAQALADINAAIGADFVVGFTNITLNTVPSGPEDDVGIFTNGGQPGHPVLVLDFGAVPEPSALALVITCLLSAGVVRCRSAVRANASRALYLQSISSAFDRSTGTIAATSLFESAMVNCDGADQRNPAEADLWASAPPRHQQPHFARRGAGRRQRRNLWRQNVAADRARFLNVALNMNLESRRG